MVKCLMPQSFVIYTSSSRLSESPNLSKWTPISMAAGVEILTGGRYLVSTLVGLAVTASA